MARPYSKKTVEEAALICDVMASGTEGCIEAARDLGIPQHTTAYRLAEAALQATCAYDDGPEAAALIRSGWMIGDPVERLKLPVETESATVAAEEPLREDEKAFFVQDHLADGATPEATFVQPLEVPSFGGTYVRDPSRPEAGTVIDLEPVEYVADTYSNGDYGADS